MITEGQLDLAHSKGQTMNNPHLVIHINSKPELVITESKDGRQTQELRHPLELLNAVGFDKASETVGRDVINALSYWYTNEFAPFREIRFEHDFQGELDLINLLISRSTRMKTKIHLETIQALIEDVVLGSPELITARPVADWHFFRDEISQYPD